MFTKFDTNISIGRVEKCFVYFYRVCCFLMTFTALLMPATAPCQDSSGIRKVGSLYHQWSFAKAISVVGQYAYISAEYGGLAIVDISNPAEPLEVGNFKHFVTGVAVSGNYAYLGYGPFGFSVVDIRDPAHPQLVGYSGVEVANIAVSGDYAYTASWGEWFDIIDIRDPTQPHRAGGFARGYLCFTDVAVAGNCAYLAAADSGLWIMNISDPEHPRRDGVFNTQGWAREIEIVGSYAYVADYGSGLRLVDVSDPAEPQELGFFEAQDNLIGVAASENYAYVADSTAGLHVIDVEDPENPRRLGFYDSPELTQVVTVADEYIYQGDTLGGITIIDISNPAEPREAGRITPGWAGDVAVAGEYAYLVNGEKGLRIINVDDPAQPREVGKYDLSRWAVGVTVKENYVYLTEGSDDFYRFGYFHNGIIHIVDIGDPEHPRQIGSYDSQDMSSPFCAASGDFIYLSVGLGMQIVDVGDPARPQEAGFFDSWPVDVDDIAISGNYAYLAGSGLSIVDVSDPADPQEVGSLDSYGKRIKISGNHAYLADFFGLHIININNPETPRAVGLFNFPTYDFFPRGLTITGNYALVTGIDDNGFGEGKGGQLFVIDVSDPTNPSQVGFYNTPGEGLGIAADGAYTYLADGTNFGIYDCSEVVGVSYDQYSPYPSSFILSPPYPNPFNSTALIEFDLPHRSTLRLVVFDLSGRQVSILADGWYGAGCHRSIWQPKGLTSGIYFIELESAEGKSVVKVVLAK